MNESSQVTIGTGSFYTTNQPLYAVHFPVTMRTTPTTTLSGTIAPTNASGNFAGNFSSATFDRNTPEFVGSNNTSGSSGLSAGNTAAIGLRQNSSISSSAEL